MRTLYIGASLLLLGVGSWADPDVVPDAVAEAEREIEAARVVVGTAARAFETARTGPGIKQVNPDRSPPLNPPGDVPYHSLEHEAHRREDAAKSVLADLEHRLSVLRGLAERGDHGWVTRDATLRPLPIAPPDGIPGGAPREPMTLGWTPVPDAAGYAVEIQCLGCCVRGEWCVSRYAPDHRTNELTVPYSGASRWRVRARTAEGWVGPASTWSHIEAGN